MPLTYKTLGQLRSFNAVPNTLYSVPANAKSIVSTISITSPPQANNLVSPSNDALTEYKASLYVCLPQGAGISWQTTSNTRTVYGATYALGNFWTVSGTAGVLQASTDGLTWTTNTTFTYATNDIIYADGVLVTVGLNRSYNYSTDGVTWDTNNTAGATTTGFNAITYGNGILVAVGINGTIQTGDILPGPFVSFQGRTSNTTSELFAAAYGNGIYLAGGNSVLVTSTTGITWTTRSISGGSPTVYSLFYNAGTYFAGTNGGLYTSTDTITWTSVYSPTMYDIKYFNGLYIGGSSNGGIHTSTDGVTWTSRYSSSSGGGYTYTTVSFDGVDTFIAAGITSAIIQRSTSTTPDYPSIQNALLYQTPVEFNSNVNLTLGLGLPANAQLRAHVGATNSQGLSFSAFGAEIT